MISCSGREIHRYKGYGSMKIDTHQHFWCYDPSEYEWITDEMSFLKKDILPNDIEPILKQHGFDGAIAVQARQIEYENAFLLNLSSQFSWIKGIIGWINLCDEVALERVGFYKESLVKGFRHLIQDERYPSQFFENKKFNDGIKKIQNLGFLYELLFREKDLLAATMFCQRHDNNLLVIDHLGKPNIGRSSLDDWYRNIKPLADLPHVYVKLSGLITEFGLNWQKKDIAPFINIAIDLFTPDRLMFGSDWPVCKLAGSYKEVYELIEGSIDSLTQNEKNKIMGENACYVYKLK